LCVIFSLSAMRFLLEGMIAAYLIGGAAALNRTVVVIGATGHTGSLVYKEMQAKGIQVRAIVRNTTKAKELLGCSRCDASEGIFKGDIKDAASLAPAMIGADAIVMAISCDQKCVFPFDCHFLPGEDPKTVIYEGTQNVVTALASSKGPALKDRQVLTVSMANTEKPPSFFFDLMAKLWGGFDVGFFNLNSEAFIMSSGMQHTIVKPCGLAEGPGSQKRLIAAHDGAGINMRNQVDRADLARVITAAMANPEISTGLRFDFCVDTAGPAQADATQILRDAMWPWDPRKNEGFAAVV